MIRKIQVLKAYSYEDSDEYIFCAMHLNGNSWKDKKKRDKIKKVLENTYGELIERLPNDEQIEQKKQLDEVANRLVRLIGSDFCGDFISWVELDVL